MSVPSEPEVSSEMLMAYADGLLDAEGSERIARDLPQRPDWQAEIAGYRLTRERLARAFDSALEEPVPDALSALVLGQPASSGGGEVIPFPAHRKRLSPARLAAAAAVFAAGTLAGGGGAALLQVASHQPAEPAIMLAGLLAPKDPLVGVLETSPSATTVSLGDDRVVRPVQSFARADGVVCREFEAGRTGAGGVAGLACRESGGWRVDVLVATPRAPGIGEGYVTASGPQTEVLDARLDALEASEGFDAQREACLIAKGFANPAACLNGPAEKGPE